ncbi:TyrR/PhhR family helix-turn-helix DNA-binding protein [Agarivorans gilvus]|jgi:TyrR family helix-turn-helix protein|uniref:Transcriptional regulator n=1 Tax=Agarivorans gilvus TaxID=680279 RepID=A0ABQ1I674_9ALTE|nr:TyrR/PhhR family helix-turn-helix DNA-binding protein [Agarivorans gilvus]GGB16357.1 transcriptional regulator [Agarivorans gilvus]
MRIELNCEQNTQVFSAVLNVLVKHGLALQAMQSADSGHLFLHLSELELPLTQQLLSEFRCLNGVSDARIVSALPSEVEHKEVQILLDNVPYPVVLIDKSGQIRQFNQAFEQSCGDTLQPLASSDIGKHLRGFSVHRWFGSGSGKREIVEIQLNGRVYMVDVIPLSETALFSHLPGAIMLFKSAHWLESSFDLSQIELGISEGRLVASSDETQSVLNALKRLVEHPLPTLLFGEAGVGKRFLARLLNEMSMGGDERFHVVSCHNQEYSLSEQLAEIAAEQPNTVLLTNVERLNGSEIEDAVNALTAPQLGIKHLIFSSRYTPEQLAALWGGDCYYSVIKNSINIPPLRQRKEDIVPLTQSWLDFQYAKHQEIPPPLTREVKRYLSSLSWPGNIPQLYQVLQDSIDIGSMKRWQVSDIKYHHERVVDNVSIESLLQQDYHSAMGEFEHLLLSYHYPQHPSSRLLAKKLGLSHTAIANKLREHNIRNKPDLDN